MLGQFLLIPERTYYRHFFSGEIAALFLVSLYTYKSVRSAFHILGILPYLYFDMKCDLIAER